MASKTEDSKQPEAEAAAAASTTAAEESKTSKKELDLAQYDGMQKSQEDGVDVPIVDPHGRRIMTMKIAGPDSQRQKDAVERLVQERIDAGETAPLDRFQREERQVRGLAMSVIGWSRFVLDGREYTYSVENAQRLFQRFPFIREQAEAVAGSRASFLKLSETDSAPLSAR